jgi:hypothetical protein
MTVCDRIFLVLNQARLPSPAGIRNVFGARRISIFLLQDRCHLSEASLLEVRALAQATAILKEARHIRKAVPKAKVVLSMVGEN